MTKAYSDMLRIFELGFGVIVKLCINWENNCKRGNDAVSERNKVLTLFIRWSIV